MLSLKTHNILDYIVGAVLILSPYLFGLADLEAARNVMILSGFFLMLYSLFTNYDYAVVRVIPLGVHMTLDVIIGVVVMIAPWVLNYRAFLAPGQEYLHYILGIGAFALVGLTKEKTEADKRRDGVRLRTQQPSAGRI